jgi:hypothetical protein
MFSFSIETKQGQYSGPYRKQKGDLLQPLTNSVNIKIPVTIDWAGIFQHGMDLHIMQGKYLVSHKHGVPVMQVFCCGMCITFPLFHLQLLKQLQWGQRRLVHANRQAVGALQEAYLHPKEHKVQACGQSIQSHFVQECKSDLSL